MRVYLTDGFAGDHVNVSVNGQTVFYGNATTKKLKADTASPSS